MGSRRESTSPLRQASHARSLGAKDPRLGRNARNLSTGQDIAGDSLFFDEMGRLAVRPSSEDVESLAPSKIAALEVDEVTTASAGYAQSEANAAIARITALEERSNQHLLRIEALGVKINELLAALRRDKRLRS